ncbi:hypothetical protein BX600DRAFT_115525 [Xylariales sp. PMI_506]|nr:hypothetical protein BX600DRAFT_115525 [Xylariales sp. PMI_506]
MTLSKPRTTEAQPGLPGIPLTGFKLFGGFARTHERNQRRGNKGNTIQSPLDGTYQLSLMHLGRVALPANICIHEVMHHRSPIDQLQRLFRLGCHVSGSEFNLLLLPRSEMMRAGQLGFGLLLNRGSYRRWDGSATLYPEPPNRVLLRRTFRLL